MGDIGHAIAINLNIRHRGIPRGPNIVADPVVRPVIKRRLTRTAVLGNGQPVLTFAADLRHVVHHQNIMASPQCDGSNSEQLRDMRRTDRPWRQDDLCSRACGPRRALVPILHAGGATLGDDDLLTQSPWHDGQTGATPPRPEGRADINCPRVDTSRGIQIGSLIGAGSDGSRKRRRPKPST